MSAKAGPKRKRGQCIKSCLRDIQKHFSKPPIPNRIRSKNISESAIFLRNGICKKAFLCRDIYCKCNLNRSNITRCKKRSQHYLKFEPVYYVTPKRFLVRQIQNLCQYVCLRFLQLFQNISYFLYWASAQSLTHNHIFAPRFPPIKFASP